MRPSKRVLVGGVAGLVLAVGVGGAAWLGRDGGGSHQAAPQAGSVSGAGLSAVVHRSPTCGCCEGYVDYLRRHGVEVRDVVTDDVASVKADYGLPADAESCHTSVVEGYAVEGHVPLEAIERLAAERPDVDAIALPGMPASSPGMGEPSGGSLEVVSVTDGDIEPFMTVTY